MAYNIFKRPMFKRGGTPAQGSGIMSHVEPRIQAAGGAFTKSGNSLLFGRGENLNDPLSLFGFNLPGSQIVEGSKIPMRNFADDAAFLVGPGKFAKVGGAGLQLLKQLPKYGKYSKLPAGYPSRQAINASGKPSQFLKPENPSSILTNRGIIERARPYASGAYEIGKSGAKTAGRNVSDYAKKYGVATGIGAAGVGGAYALLKDSGLNKTQQNQINIQANNAANKNTKGNKSNKFKESDTRTSLQKETDKLREELGDKNLDRAELAFLIAKAAKTGGSISDKLEVANDEAIKLAAAKRKRDRETKLLAYKSQELPAAGKISQRAAALASKENLTDQEKAELENLRTFIDKESYGEKKLLGAETDYYFANRQRLPMLENSIKELQKKDPKSLKTDEKEELNNLLTEYRTLKNIEKKLYPTFKEGGRVNYAYGTPEPFPEGDILATGAGTEGDMITTETAGEGNVMPMKPVDKLDFSELRNKLPKEITDDIVQLIANSEEALQDFAYIKSQQDINSFNLKYGVNLVLPPQKG